ncbi:MAG: AAA family ATPase [Thermodesulfobacteriota bacterium]
MERTLEKLIRIREELGSVFFERDDVLEGSLISLLTSNHLLLIGPPGTAKSLLANELCKRISGGFYFQWLLTKFSTPEEIFGAISLKGLENDEYRRVTERKLPEAHVVFLDEVFKANSSILNALLTVMNERIFHNGKEIIKIPLMCLFGASNELPSEEDDLDALYDRFLLRYLVDYIEEDFRFLKMLQTEVAEPSTFLTIDEVNELQSLVDDVVLPPKILKLIARVRNELIKKSLILSDRRYKQVIKVLKAKALLSGRSQVDEADMDIFQHVLWKEPSEKNEIKMTLFKILHGFREKIAELLMQSKELEAYAFREWENEEMALKACIEAQTKLKKISSELDVLSDELSERGKNFEKVKTAKSQVEDIQKKILNSIVSENQEII